MSERQGKTIEVAFFPYKASMWDSMESIWRAADADPECHAVVVPIPYYDKTPEGEIAEWHYEIDLYPEDVPVVPFEEYDHKSIRPDIIFIHNPYDDTNKVTSIHPDYYSFHLKLYTDCLVYTPYFALAGNLADNYSDFSAYHYVDYILIQNKEHRKSFDPALPDEMFLPFGSPKFDSVIARCRQPKPVPDAWKIQMEGKRVFFFNTSLKLAVNETGDYLKKIGEVFGAFAGRENVCLLWRPHPLLESTFDSMLPGYGDIYRRLRELYLRQNIGIYDDTPDVDDTIAWADAYIGDTGSSVISSVAVAGKPMYILDNKIHNNPTDKDYLGAIFRPALKPDEDDRWIVGRGDELWYSEKNDYHYRFVCKLVDKNMATYGDYYTRAKETDGKVYILPGNAQSILIYENGELRHIELKREVNEAGAFGLSWVKDGYLWLLPLRYPYVVRMDLETEEVTYHRDLREFFIHEEAGGLSCGGVIWNENELVLASPIESKLLFVDSTSMKKELVDLGGTEFSGCAFVVRERILGCDPTEYDKTEHEVYWLLPQSGYDLIRFDRTEGKARVYHAQPEGFTCIHWPSNLECDARPFNGMIFPEKGKAIISPQWGSMYVELDLESGACTEWDPPHPKQVRSESPYLPCSGMGFFLGAHEIEAKGEKKVKILYLPERRLYEYDFENHLSTEIPISFEENAAEEFYGGFQDDGRIYACHENAFNTLQEMIADTLPGAWFDREYQIKKSTMINASPDGDCGEKVYRYLKEKVSR